MNYTEIVLPLCRENANKARNYCTIAPSNIYREKERATIVPETESFKLNKLYINLFAGKMFIIFCVISSFSVSVCGSRAHRPHNLPTNCSSCRSTLPLKLFLWQIHTAKKSLNRKRVMKTERKTECIIMKTQRLSQTLSSFSSLSLVFYVAMKFTGSLRHYCFTEWWLIGQANSY